MLNNSLKTLHTNIISTRFIFYKTHQSLARNKKNIPGITFRKCEYKDLSSKYFFLISNNCAHEGQTENDVVCTSVNSELQKSFILLWREVEPTVADFPTIFPPDH